MRRMLPAALATALAAALVLLAGCSDGDDPEPKIPPDTSSAAGTPSTSPTPSGPVEPTLPPEAAGDDAAAAEAFVRFYWEMVNYAQATGDVDGLVTLATSTCAACSGGLDGIRTTYESGGSIDGGEVRVARLSSQEYSAGAVRGYLVTVRAQVTPQTVRSASGDQKEYGGGTERFRMVVEGAPAGWQIARMDQL